MMYGGQHMWTRAELKSKAKAVLRNSYWESIVAVIILGAISIGAALVAYFIPFGSIFAMLFLTFPMTVGLNFFFMQNQIAPSRIPNIFYPFNSGRYMNIVGAMAWMYLFTCLWSLISAAGFIIVLIKGMSSLMAYLTADNFTPSPYAPTFDSSWIPSLVACGVIYIAGLVITYIKGLSYSMTAYILTDNPYIGYARALKLSMAMTYGQKWEMFVLYLSFIGWGLLALLTFGIGFLFLAPYVAATNAELYVKLRDHAINSGLTTPQELNVYNTNQNNEI
jgi:uncharacterized membrane protein